ncbi:hypothetical protein GF385_04055, partial [Candidatus Dependentiae bacterium]|nr:hypothetical protein [Candidatus Dependentiae bacterium]
MGFFKIKKIFIDDSKSWTRFFVEIILIFILSLVPIIWIVQKNPTVQNNIIKKLTKVLEEEWGAQISVQSYDINFFTGKILLKNGEVRSLKNSEKDFFWNFEKAKVFFSRLDFFFNDYFLMDVIFKKINAKTSIKNGHLDISNHLEKIVIQDSSIGGKLRSIEVNDINLEIEHNSNIFFIKLLGEFGLKKIGNSFINKYWTGYLFLNDGTVVFNDKILLNDLRLSSIFSENDIDSKSFSQNSNGSFIFLDNSFYLKGLQKKLSFENENNFINFDFSRDKINLDANIKVDIFYRFINFILNKKEISNDFIKGDCKLNLNLQKNNIKGDILLSNLKLPFLRNSNFKGNIDFSNNKKKIDLENLNKISLFDSWFIKPDNCK